MNLKDRVSGLSGGLPVLRRSILVTSGFSDNPRHGAAFKAISCHLCFLMEYCIVTSI